MAGREKGFTDCKVVTEFHGLRSSPPVFPPAQSSHYRGASSTLKAGSGGGRGGGEGRRCGCHRKDWPFSNGKEPPSPGQRSPPSGSGPWLAERVRQGEPLCPLKTGLKEMGVNYSKREELPAQCVAIAR